MPAAATAFFESGRGGARYPGCCSGHATLTPPPKRSGKRGVLGIRRAGQRRPSRRQVEFPLGRNRRHVQVQAGNGGGQLGDLTARGPNGDPQI
jgi:hypothetical protein